MLIEQHMGGALQRGSVEGRAECPRGCSLFFGSHSTFCCGFCGVSSSCAVSPVSRPQSAMAWTALGTCSLAGWPGHPQPGSACRVNSIRGLFLLLHNNTVIGLGLRPILFETGGGTCLLWWCGAAAAAALPSPTPTRPPRRTSPTPLCVCLPLYSTPRTARTARTAGTATSASRNTRNTTTTRRQEPSPSKPTIPA